MKQSDVCLRFVPITICINLVALYIGDDNASKFIDYIPIQSITSVFHIGDYRITLQ